MIQHKTFLKLLLNPNQLTVFQVWIYCQQTFRICVLSAIDLKNDLDPIRMACSCTESWTHCKNVATVTTCLLSSPALTSSMTFWPLWNFWLIVMCQCWTLTHHQLTQPFQIPTLVWRPVFRNICSWIWPMALWKRLWSPSQGPLWPLTRWGLDPIKLAHNKPVR